MVSVSGGGAGADGFGGGGFGAGVVAAGFVVAGGAAATAVVGGGATEGAALLNFTSSLLAPATRTGIGGTFWTGSFVPSGAKTESSLYRPPVGTETWYSPVA